MFNLDKDEPCPTKDFFATFHPVASISGNPCVGLDSTHPKAADYRQHFKTKITEAYLRIGRREIRHGRIPEAFKATTLPSDTSPSSMAGDAIATAISSGIAASISARIPNASLKSQADRSHDINVQTTLAYFRLMGASFNEEGFVVPAEINPAFEEILAHPTVTRQVEFLVAALALHVHTIQDSDPTNFYFKHITLDTDLIKGPLGYTFLRASLKKDPLNVSIDLCKTQFSILAVTTPRPHSSEYRDYMQNGSLVQAQEMVDEHHSKRAASGSGTHPNHPSNRSALPVPAVGDQAYTEIDLAAFPTT